MQFILFPKIRYYETFFIIWFANELVLIAIYHLSAPPSFKYAMNQYSGALYNAEVSDEAVIYMCDVALRRDVVIKFRLGPFEIVIMPYVKY